MVRKGFQKYSEETKNGDDNEIHNQYEISS